MEKVSLQQICIYNRDACSGLHSDSDWIFQYLALIWKCKSAFERFGSDYPLRLLCVSFTALVQRAVAMVKAFADGTGVFMVQGLQLILAILLMVLGIIIVYTSGKELVKRKKGTEAA